MEHFGDEESSVLKIHGSQVSDVSLLTIYSTY